MITKFLLIIFLTWQCTANPVLQQSTEKNLRNLANDPYDLNMPIKDISYHLIFKLKENFHEEDKRSYEGTTIVRFTTTNVIQSIKIHCDQIIANSVVGVAGAVGVAINDGGSKIINGATYDILTEILTVTLEKEYPKDTNIILTIDFLSSIRNDLKGFYLSTYQDRAGNNLYVASTQFQPTYARSAFPCFDEPKYKANFGIAINHHETYYAVSNAKGQRAIPNKGMIETNFKQSPLMSSYLVAFAVHNMASTNVINGKMDIYYPAIYKGTEEVARSVSENILNELNKFTNKKWDEVKNVAKIDQIVIPEFGGGAMENWGLVTYKDVSLLWDAQNSGSYNMEKVISLISHEFAHTWFGNLVTLSDWDYTWLNEGFAQFFEHYIPDQLTKNTLINENFEKMKQFPLIQQQAVFISDADSNTVPLNHAVKTPDEISKKFNEISYKKGASILYMMYHFLGEDVFRTGIQTYINAFEDKNVEPNNFYRVFGAVNGIPMTQLMVSWDTLPGFPLVTVTLDLNTNKIKFVQERFLYTQQEGGDQDSYWSIPISYEVITDESNQARVTPSLWLRDADEEINEPIGWDENSAIIVNIDETGYYRVNYDEVLWSRIKNILDKTPTQISDLNRAQIVDDVLNLARANKITYDFALTQIKFLQSELSYYPWYSAFQGFSFLLKHLTDNSRDLMKNYLMQYTANLYQKVIDVNPKNHIERLRKSLVWKWACDLENLNCLQAANDLFEDIGVNPIPPDLRPSVYCSAIRQGNNTHWDKLYKKFEDSLHPTEKENIITALGCSKNPNLLNVYLERSLVDGIKSQDAYKVFEAVLIGNSENVDVALKFLIENTKRIWEKYKNLNYVTKIINNLADRITTEEQKDKFTTFVEDTINNDLGDAQPVAEAALITIQRNFDWYDANEGEIMTFLDNYTITSSTSSSTESTTTVSTTTAGAASQTTISFILLITVLIFVKLF